LTSLPHGIEILVLDANSRDHTTEFARAAGANVIEREWTDFLEARRFALSHVKTPWVLMIDADEALDDRLREAMQTASADVGGYVIFRTTFYCGKPLRMWSNEPLLRLFRAEGARINGVPIGGGSAPLHERWFCEGKVERLPGTLLHYSYPDASTYRAKYNEYTSIEGAALRKSYGMPALLVRGMLAALLLLPRFLRMLLIKGELLDGPRGIAIAYWSAVYPFIATRKALFG